MVGLDGNGRFFANGFCWDPKQNCLFRNTNMSFKILGPKACKIQNILTKKVFQFHPYSDVFCWHVFFFHFGKVNGGKIYKKSTAKGVATCIRTEVLRSWSGIAPCTECITSGLKATGSPRCLGTAKPWEILMLHLGRLKVNLSQVGFFLVKCGLKYVLLWRFTGLWNCGGSSATKIAIFRNFVFRSMDSR